MGTEGIGNSGGIEYNGGRAFTVRAKPASVLCSDRQAPSQSLTSDSVAEVLIGR